MKTLAGAPAGSWAEVCQKKTSAFGLSGGELERSTLRVCAQLRNGQSLPRLGQLRPRESAPQTVARFPAELEAAEVGIEAIAMTMLQGVLQRAVEWGRVPSNAVELTRKPPKPHRLAVQAIPPSLIEVMRARLLREGRLRDATLLVVLGYAGVRPQEALALEWRHVRERTLLVERALSDGQLKALTNRRQPRAVELLAPLREDLDAWRGATSSLPTAPVFPPRWRLLARDRLANWRKRIYKPTAEAVGINGARLSLSTSSARNSAVSPLTTSPAGAWPPIICSSEDTGESGSSATCRTGGSDSPSAAGGIAATWTPSPRPAWPPIPH